MEVMSFVDICKVLIVLVACWYAGDRFYSALERWDADHNNEEETHYE